MHNKVSSSPPSLWNMNTYCIFILKNWWCLPAWSCVPYVCKCTMHSSSYIPQTLERKFRKIEFEKEIIAQNCCHTIYLQNSVFNWKKIVNFTIMSFGKIPLRKNIFFFLKRYLSSPTNMTLLWHNFFYLAFAQFSSTFL